MDPFSLFALEESSKTKQLDTITSETSNQQQTFDKLGLSSIFNRQQSIDIPKSNEENVSNSNTIVEAKKKYPINNEEEDTFQYLTGEQKVMNIVDSFIILSPTNNLPGMLFMSNYRIVFIPAQDTHL